MKKSIALVAMSFGVSSIFAQDLTSKKGEPFLPEAGDYAVSIDANPFLNYVGNFFGKTANNVAPTWNFLNGNNMIIGKYFKDANTAYRLGLRIGLSNNTTKNKLVDQSTTPPTFPTLPTYSEDVMKAKTTAVGLMAGIEKRKGKTRLQGFYGADLMIFASSSKSTYEYAQTIEPAGTDPDLVTITTTGANANTTNFGTNIDNTPTTGNIGRVTSMKTGNGFGLGVRAFIGAEYFILPKISIGGEFGWGVGVMTGGKTVTETEVIDNATNSKSNISEETKNGGKFALDTDLNNTGTGSILAPSASLRLNLHF